MDNEVNDRVEVIYNILEAVNRQGYKAFTPQDIDNDSLLRQDLPITYYEIRHILSRICKTNIIVGCGLGKHNQPIYRINE